MLAFFKVAQKTNGWSGLLGIMILTSTPPNAAILIESKEKGHQV